MQAYKEVTLARHCIGTPKPDDFTILEKPLPETAKDGQFRVRHVWCSVDPGTRSRLSGGDSYAAALPTGSPVDGFSVGIVEASRNDKFPDGMAVAVAGGWRSHSIQNGRGFVVPIPDAARSLPLGLWIGVLGVPGLTGWFGLKETARFREGDIVLVSSAAGPVGATAGQLAKSWGASHVVGIAGSDEKCQWLKNEAGFDAVINYKAVDDLDAAIRNACPDGVDILFDNVGNKMIDRVLPLMRLNGRICISGQVADYNLAAEDVPGIHNTKPFITHRVTMQGLVVFDFARDFSTALMSMAQMIASGQLKVKEEFYDGIESMPEAFCGLFRGDNFGRRIIKVGDE